MKKSILFLAAGILFAPFLAERLYSQSNRSLKETFDFYVKSVQNENLEDLFFRHFRPGGFLFFDVPG